MNETVDKIADKLITSIQKSQNSSNNGNANDTDTPKAKAASKTKAVQKTKVQSEPGVKKIIDEIITTNSIESPRKLVGNLRWPD